MPSTSCDKDTCGAVVHSTKPELRFCTGLNTACGESEFHDGEDL